MPSTKNKVPSAPEDYLEPGRTFTKDGRKRADKEFVGAKTPDVEPERSKPRRRRH